jgi:hypothetical protein
MNRHTMKTGGAARAPGGFETLVATFLVTGVITAAWTGDGTMIVVATLALAILYVVWRRLIRG